MTIDLSTQEQDLLVQILKRELSEMPSEIRRTQTSSYRVRLKDEEHILCDLYNRLRDGVTV